MIKIIGTHASPYTRKVRIVAAEKKIEFDYVIDNPWGEAAAVKSNNPLGKVPVLVLDDGATLFDSRVIVEHLDHISPVGKLIPANNRERIEVKRWEALADGVLDAMVAVRLEGLRDAALRSTSWTDRQQAKAVAGIAEMEKQLGAKPWCAGGAFSLADIAVGVCMGWLDYRFAQLDLRRDAPNLARLMQKLAERPSFAETVPRD
jgi:glutathione S-transferase